MYVYPKLLDFVYLMCIQVRFRERPHQEPSSEGGGQFGTFNNQFPTAGHVLLTPPPRLHPPPPRIQAKYLKACLLRPRLPAKPLLVAMLLLQYRYATPARPWESKPWTLHYVRNVDYSKEKCRQDTLVIQVMWPVIKDRYMTNYK